MESAFEARKGATRRTGWDTGPGTRDAGRDAGDDLGMLQRSHKDQNLAHSGVEASGLSDVLVGLIAGPRGSRVRCSKIRLRGRRCSKKDPKEEPST